MTIIDKSSKWKIDKEILDWNNTLDQINIIDIYRAFHPRTPEYTFFCSAHRTFSSIDYTLKQKTSLNKLRKIEIIPSMVYDHSTLKLESNCKKKSGQTTNMWKFKNMQVNNGLVKKEMRLKDMYRPMRMAMQHIKILRTQYKW